MRIAMGSDHAGFDLKRKIVAFLRELGHQVEDMGTTGTEPADYPDYAREVCAAVKAGLADLGVLVCGTGLGMAIAANKVPGIRAVACTDAFSARCSREHNDANVLCLGERVVGDGVARDIVATWLSAGFLGGRHQRRVDKIAEIEKECLTGWKAPEGGGHV